MIPYHGYETGLHHAGSHYSHHNAASGAAMEEARQQPRLFFKMPRVVPNQRERFESEDLFKRNVREMEVRFTLYRDRPLLERQAKFHQGCREGHLEVSHASTGLVLILTWNPMHNGYGERVRYGCDVNKEPGKVHIRSPLIINGVCVRWKGWLDLERLDGIGCVEFDEEMAAAEDEVLRKQIEMYNQRLKDLEHQHRRHNEHIQQLKKLHY